MKKLLFFAAACAVFVVGCGDKSGGDSGATAGATGTTTESTSGTTTGGATADKSGATSDATSGATAGSGAGFGAVQAVFNSSCTGCHGANNPKAGINLTSYETVMKGGKEGPIVKAGDPENSVIVQALHGANHKRQMPPRGKLADDQIKVVEDWIKDGAKS